MRLASHQQLKPESANLMFLGGWNCRPNSFGDCLCEWARCYAGHLSGSWLICVKKQGLKSKKGLTRAAHWQITRSKLAFGQVFLSRIAAFLGAIAQLGERLLCKQEVVGSIPSGSTKFHPELPPSLC